MERLKSLRISRNYTQKDVAAMLQTTQQTVARWETGKTEPPISALRDLATIFSTSVDDILGSNPFSERLVTNSYYLLRDQDADGFWGHLGLLLPSKKKSIWYPITDGERQRVWQFLRNERDELWLVVTTLNNRMLAIRPEATNRLWLLDDACDEPKGDWEWKTLWDDYNGLPKELYRAMSEWASDRSDFEKNNSSKLQEIALATIKEASLESDPDSVMKAIHFTTIHLTNGDSFSYECEPSDLWAAIQDIELGDIKVLYLPAIGGDFESFFPCAKIALIDMPLIDVEEAAQASIKELEEG